MLDRPSPSDAALSGPARRTAPGWPLAFVGIAGLLGAGGVAVGAAGAHLGGGDLSRTSSGFLIMHAAALVAAAGFAPSAGRGSALLAAAMGLIAAGAALFGGELAMAALFDWRPVPLAAPVGGLCLIGGWLCLAAVPVVVGFRGR